MSCDVLQFLLGLFCYQIHSIRKQALDIYYIAFAVMGQERITFVEKFDYNFARNKNYRTFRRERISWQPEEVIRRWDHRWMAAAPCSDRFVGAGTPVASRKVSQRKSWKSSSWRSYLRRPGSGQRANRCTRCLCSRIGHCEAATIADASQFHGSRCTRIHRIRRSWWWGWCQLLGIDQIKRKYLTNFHKESQNGIRRCGVSIRSFFPRTVPIFSVT